jgi:hypothetical protein
MREQRNLLAEDREVVEGAHRHVDFVRDALHIEQDLRRILLDERTGKAAYHERMAGDEATLSHAPLPPRTRILPSRGSGE